MHTTHSRGFQEGDTAATLTASHQTSNTSQPEYNNAHLINGFAQGLVGAGSFSAAALSQGFDWALTGLQAQAKGAGHALFNTLMRSGGGAADSSAVGSVGGTGGGGGGGGGGAADDGNEENGMWTNPPGYYEPPGDGDKKVNQDVTSSREEQKQSESDVVSNPMLSFG
jgi:hypothetical protein